MKSHENQLPPPPPTGPLPDPPTHSSGDLPVITKAPSPPTTPNTSKSSSFHYHHYHPPFSKKPSNLASQPKSSSLTSLHDMATADSVPVGPSPLSSSSTTHPSHSTLESKKNNPENVAASPVNVRLNSRVASSPMLSRAATVSHAQTTQRASNIQMMQSLQGQGLSRDMTVKKVMGSPQLHKSTGPTRSLSVKNVAALDKTTTNTPVRTPLHKPLDYSAASMHWYKVNEWGRRCHVQPKPLRAHTMTLVNDKLFVWGGCDIKGQCQSDVMILDPDTLQWSIAKTRGTVPPPCRAHSCVLVDSKLYIYGGGDADTYFDALYTLDTQTFQWEKCQVEPDSSLPGPRRAHTSWAYQGHVYIYAGGDGARALGDVYRLQVLAPTPNDTTSTSNSTLSVKKPLASLAHGTRVRWHLVSTTGAAPTARGYHTSNLVGSKVVVFGGSDGHECFSDVYLLDMKDLHWTHIPLNESIPRLSHTSTLVGSYLFIMGGHDGTKYTSSVLLLNLVTMRIERRRVTSQSALGGPKGRGYHVACCYDSRIFMYGGYDGEKVYDDVWVLELSACGYLPQITAFEIK